MGQYLYNLVTVWPSSHITRMGREGGVTLQPGLQDTHSPLPFFSSHLTFHLWRKHGVPQCPGGGGTARPRGDTSEESQRGNDIQANHHIQHPSHAQIVSLVCLGIINGVAATAVFTDSVKYEKDVQVFSSKWKISPLWLRPVWRCHVLHQRMF